MTNNIYATHKPDSGNNLYLRLKDGETMRIRIASEPAIFETENENEDGTTRISTRYAWVIWNREVGLAQVFEQSATFFKQLAGFAMDDDYGDPQQYDIKVSRKGTGLTTEYTIIPGTKKEPLGTDELAATKQINLLEKLGTSPYAQRVAWLSDFETNSKPAPAETKGPSVAEQSKAKETAIEDLGGEEINLDDIPF